MKKEKYNQIYVFCPYGVITGGPDALHQIVYYLNDLGITAHIVYYDIVSRKKKIPFQYEKYIKDYLLLKDVMDLKKNAAIFPEIITSFVYNYKKLDKYIWWLSVDHGKKVSPSLWNRLKHNPFKNLHYKVHKHIFSQDNSKSTEYKFNNKIEVTHLCASYYAYNYVESHLVNNRAILLIEPISKIFLENTKKLKNHEKVDAILYNPSKNFEFTDKVIKHCPDLEFTPIKGYNQKQLIELYSRTKVYIDFGPFPGAERIPKEAVLYGCTILTGRNGASNFYGDVPIKDEYKIESKVENVEFIRNKLLYMLENYEIISNDFVEYRNTVAGLETEFIKNLSNIFLK